MSLSCPVEQKHGHLTTRTYIPTGIVSTLNFWVANFPPWGQRAENKLKHTTIGSALVNWIHPSITGYWRWVISLQDMEIPFSQSVSQSKQYPSAVIGFTRKGNQGLRHEYSMVKWSYKNIDNHHFECPLNAHEYWNSNRCLTCRQATKGRHTPPPSSTTLPRTGSKRRVFVNS